jgi:hypothetical protein
VTQFQITGYHQYYYHVITSTSLVVISSRTEDYDARPVPAASNNIVGFRSAHMFAVPAYKNTKMDIFYYQDTLIKGQSLSGGMSKTDPTQFSVGSRYHRSGYSQFQCRAAVYLKSTDKLGAAQFADYDGLEATPFVSLSLLSTEWVLPMEAEYVAFLAVRPDSSSGRVDLKVYSPNGLLKETITTFKRYDDGPTNDNGLDKTFRPSCYNYYPVSGIPPGTRFVTDYPSFMAWEIKASDDETLGSGRGSWVWAQVDQTLLRVEENGDETTGKSNSKSSSYKVRFMSHDPNGKLGYLGRPTKDVIVSMTSDAQVSINPTRLTFDASNWNQWQTVTVTANTDYLVENLVVTSIIRHVVTSKDIQFANGRVNVPDVVVDVINTDFDAVPTNVRIAKYTGGLIGVGWDAPAAALQNPSDIYNYALEVTDGTLVEPTILTTNATCNKPGCIATINFNFPLPKILRAASITVRIRQTDFDDDAELIEYITVNGDTVRTNCNPGGPTIGGGLCSDTVKDQTPTCVKDYQLNTSSVMSSVDENGQASISISIKASTEVDKSTCLDSSIALLHADIYLKLMYKTNDEVYFGPLLYYEQADLIHSTPYKVRVASSSPQGIFSSYSIVVNARTKKPTAPTEPRANNMIASTGGAIDAKWIRPKDTGGALLVKYFVSFNK